MNRELSWKLTAAMVVVLAASLTAGGQTTRKADKPTSVIVFDFTSSDNDKQLGRAISDSVRLRLRRGKQFNVVVDRLMTQEISDPLGVEVAQKRAAVLIERAGANLGVYGTVRYNGKVMTAYVRCIDLEKRDSPAGWRRNFSDDSERARGLIAHCIVEAILGSDEWTPPQYGDEAEPISLGRPLNINGSFDAGAVGWDAPDNVATFIVPATQGRGKILRIRTDLARDPWLAYRRRLRFGQADPGNPPTIPPDTTYGSVAGLEGVHYRGSWIRAKAGARYWMVADVKAPSEGAFCPKIFVKGFIDWSAHADSLPETSLHERGLAPRQFAEMPVDKQRKLIAADARAHGERYRRECYRWYLNCRGVTDNEWKHLAAPFPPRGGLPDNVQWLQVQVYAYWPPGEYLFDNVHLYADPDQKASIPQAAPSRTPNYKTIRLPTTRKAPHRDNSPRPGK